MREKINLSGITWDHPRGYEAIRAVSEVFCEKHPGVEIRWDVRSLKDFGDYPVTLLAENYDLIMLDHPHLGSAVRARALVPLDVCMEPEFLLDQKKNSVGRSYESYHMDGHPWALAVDAAAQVSAYRPDLMERLGEEMPETWEQVRDMAGRLEGKVRVGFPLCPTDCYCSFLTICANHAGEQFFDRENGLDRGTEVYALKILGELSELVHKDSLDMNPIQMLDRMARTDEIAYVPLLFGYSNYARKKRENGRLVRFTNIPSEREVPSGALLGGVGLAISSRCRHRELAAEFAAFAACGETQKGVYYRNAGQPGYLGAWTDLQVNADSSGFFEDTLLTLENSYLRPRYEGYNRFQEAAGRIINEGLRGHDHPERVADRLDASFRELKAGEKNGRYAS